MNQLAFGIDLGTSTSEICFVVNGRPMPINDVYLGNRTPVVPSVVALALDGQELLVGQRAIDEGDAQHKVREAKRRMGEDFRFGLGLHELLPEEVAALVLRYMAYLGKMATGEDVTEAVITVPAYFDDLPRRATEQAAILAGIRPLRLISEPVAAALAYGIDRLDEEQMLLVFDFGGGTLDVSLIDMFSGVLDVRATDGDKALGGKDMDALVMARVTSATGFEVPVEGTSAYDALKKAVESAKKSLTTADSTLIYLSHFDGRRDLEYTLTRAEFNTIIDPLLDRAISRIQACMQKARIDKSKVGKLLLVGGTCYIPYVIERVETFLGVKSEEGVDRDLAVAMGAAISAGLKIGAVDQHSLVVQDASTFRLGVDCFEWVGDREMLVFSELMPAGASIPYVKTNRFNLGSLEQDQVMFSVLLADGTGNLLAEDAKHTGASGVIRDIPPSTTGEPRSVDVELRYDENHIIRVSARVVGIDRECVVQLNSNQFANDPLSSMSASNSVVTLWEQSPLADRNANLIRRAEDVISRGPTQTELIEAALEDLKNAVARNDAAQTQKARERLTGILADL